MTIEIRTSLATCGRTNIGPDVNSGLGAREESTEGASFGAQGEPAGEADLKALRQFAEVAGMAFDPAEPLEITEP